jgi:hypothetical protein
MRWAFLEAMLDELVLSLLSVDTGDIGALTSNMEFHEKIKVVLALGFKKRLDDDWFKQLKTLLDHIENVIGPQRNRYVHDLWTSDGVRVKKLEFRTAIKKPQSRKPLELKTKHETSVKPEEIWAAAEAIESAAGHVASFARMYQAHNRALRGK